MGNVSFPENFAYVLNEWSQINFTLIFRYTTTFRSNFLLRANLKILAKARIPGYACPHLIHRVVSVYWMSNYVPKNQTDPSISSGDITHKRNPANWLAESTISIKKAFKTHHLDFKWLNLLSKTSNSSIQSKVLSRDTEPI